MPDKYLEREFDRSNPSTWSMDSKSVIIGTPQTGLSRPLNLRRVYYDSEHSATNFSAADIESVRVEARSMACKIFFSWKLLNAILRRHESLLRERWSKMTKSERRQLLIELWPEIPHNHRSDLQSLHPGEDEPTIDAQMWPSINLEDLMDSQILALLIRSRGRTPPPLFAHSDLESCRMCISFTGPLATLVGANRQILGLAMVMEDADSEQAYGSLVPPPSSNRPLKYYPWAPAMGMVVLKIQERLLNFLLHCCRRVLHDQFVVGPQKDFNPPRPDPGDIRCASAQGDPEYRSVVAANTEIPYRPPVVPDFAFLLELVTSKRDQVEDTLFTLREDPQFFVTRVQYELDHSIHLVWGVHNLDDPDARKKYVEKHRNLLTSGMIGDLFRTHRSWAIIEYYLRYIAGLEPQVDAAKRLIMSQELARCLHQCWHSLEQLKLFVMDKIRYVHACCPALRKEWELVEHPNDSAPYLLERGNRLVLDRLGVVLQDLVDSRKEFYVGAHNLVDQVERLFQKDETQRARVSPYVLEWISELGAIAEAQRQLQLFRLEDWATDTTMDSTKRNGLYDASMAPVHILNASLKGLELWSLADPASGMWYYPCDEPLTKRVVGQLRLAETNLANFWGRVDNKVRAQTGTDWFELLDIEMRQPYRTKPHQMHQTKQPKTVKMRGALAPLMSLDMLREKQATNAQQATDTASAILGTTDRAKKHNHATKEVGADVANINSGKVIPEVCEEKFDKFAAARMRTKEKTRRTEDIVRSSQPDTASSSAAPLESLDITHVKISVPKNAVQTFRALFTHASTRGSQRKQVSWRHFLQAMNAAGLTPHKVYGSVWHFISSTASGRRAINIHEPHPESSLSPSLLRQIGRRLNRAFHWDEETFVAETGQEPYSKAQLS